MDEITAKEANESEAAEDYANRDNRETNLPHYVCRHCNTSGFVYRIYNPQTGHDTTYCNKCDSEDP